MSINRRQKASPLSKLFYFIKEGFSSVFTHGLTSFAAITVIAACLLITATFILIAYNLDVQIGKLQNRDEIVVYISEDYSREQALSLQNEIDSLNNVASSVFVSKEEFFDKTIESFGEDAYILEAMREDNPLRDSYRITMKDVGHHLETLKALEEIEGIADSNSDVELSERLVQLRTIMQAVSYTLIILLGAVSLFIISNTVRLALFLRKDEVEIMRIVGATNRFIRAPFVVEGIILGVVAAVFVFSAQWLVYNYITGQLVVGTSVIEMVPFEEFRYRLAFWLLVAGVGLGCGGSIITLRRFLKV